MFCYTGTLAGARSCFFFYRTRVKLRSFASTSKELSYVRTGLLPVRLSANQFDKSAKRFLEEEKY